MSVSPTLWTYGQLCPSLTSLVQPMTFQISDATTLIRHPLAHTCPLWSPSSSSLLSLDTPARSFSLTLLSLFVSLAPWLSHPLPTRGS